MNCCTHHILQPQKSLEFKLFLGGGFGKKNKCPAKRETALKSVPNVLLVMIMKFTRLT